MKREVAWRTGGWYHGARGHAYHDDTQLKSTAADMLRRKLKDLNADSNSSDRQVRFQSRGKWRALLLAIFFCLWK